MIQLFLGESLWLVGFECLGRAFSTNVRLLTSKWKHHTFRCTFTIRFMYMDLGATFQSHCAREGIPKINSNPIKSGAIKGFRRPPGMTRRKIRIGLMNFKWRSRLGENEGRPDCSLTGEEWKVDGSIDRVFNLRTLDNRKPKRWDPLLFLLFESRSDDAELL